MTRTLLLAGALSAMLVGCSRPSPLYFSEAEAEPAPPGRFEVINADAMVVNGHYLRLANAVAPQMAPDARCWAEALAGRQARQSVQRLLAKAKDIAVTPTGGVDEYNRPFSRVKVDGVDLGQILLDDSMAATPGTERFDWCGPLSSSNSGRGPRYSVLTQAGGLP